MDHFDFDFKILPQIPFKLTWTFMICYPLDLFVIGGNFSSKKFHETAGWYFFNPGNLSPLNFDH